MKALGNRLLLLWKKYERHINLFALVSGFTFDLIIAKRPDSVVDNILLISYLFICGAVIVLLNIRNVRRKAKGESEVEPLLLLLILQFCFGGLANNMLILYGKSGTLAASLLFIGLLAAFALGNEFLKGRYEQLRFNVAIYYFLLLTYLVIAVPTFLLHSIGAEVFLASGVLSLILIAPFLAVLYYAVFRKREIKQMQEVAAIILCIFAVFNLLYFTNLIPPVPLSLKEIGVYHTLVRTDDQSGVTLYTASFEPAQWYIFWRDTSSTFTYRAGENAYCFSAVFAPGQLSAPIVHRWEKMNTEGKWVTQSLVSFPISGGRAEGYRGWSIQTPSTGKWRCDVETARGQLIGRISFDVVEGTSAPLSTATL